jgi:hypothetical protein
MVILPSQGVTYGMAAYPAADSAYSTSLPPAMQNAQVCTISRKALP